ncbi:gfo/Idh/MocA family oxidoreductase [Hymenobacter oligotrophus]|uniref:Gfo/Idh/MocA family oxidoreductase n=1 Tax=Hymenobacter oligotrophus TaxID=2319843 RepID=A0A3B7R0E4_9BACT|nr:Gfo/Idh/MocA family oxidoreductase [Hymenobacter oligotrophus]AYA36923.1 gfo/Idh/MocA family oxidoreductase [Hymenobacter oligotrophus]
MDATDSRRRFLRQAGLGAAVAALAAPGAAAAMLAQPLTAAMQNSDKKKLGWAIVGLGKFATEEIMPNFKDCQHSRLVALVSGSPDKAQKLAQQYGLQEKNIYSYQNFDSIKDNPEVDVVYIILPNSLHAEYTIRAAQAGKHVLCEKPMATSVHDCQKMIDACQKAGKQLMIAYRCQYEPFNLNAIERIRKGELGKLRFITSDHGRRVKPTEDKADTWRVQKKLAGGGSLMDIGIYSLNAARYFAGEEPVEVTAQIASDPNDPRFKEVEDNVAFTLRFPSGVLAACTSSYSYETVKRGRVFGDKGWLDLDPLSDYDKHTMKIGKPDGKEEPQLKEGNQFAAEIDHLSECILQNKTPRTPGEEGLRDVRYIMAIYESARKGKAIKV